MSNCEEKQLRLRAERFGNTPDGILNYLAEAIFQYHPVSAERPPSTIPETVPASFRPSMRVFEDCDGIGYISDSRPTYVHAKVSQPALDEFIASMMEADAGIVSASGLGMRIRERIPVLDFVKLARDSFGWNFGGESMDPLDLEIGMRQAAVDGSIPYWGRKAPDGTPDSILDHFPLVGIPPEHFAEYRLVALAVNLTTGARGGPFENRRTKTYRLGNDSQPYVDLHMGRREAMQWLEHGAAEYRGRTDDARGR